MSATCPACSSPGIQIMIPDEYEHGGLFWICSQCDLRWHRWPEGTGLHMKAKRYIHRREYLGGIK